MRRLQKPTIKGISPVDQVEDVNVPILVIHGDVDNVVHVDHSRRFVRELERYNKDHKYVEIEGLDHSPRYYDHKTEFYSELLNWLRNHNASSPRSLVFGHSARVYS